MDDSLNRDHWTVISHRDHLTVLGGGELPSNSSNRIMLIIVHYRGIIVVRNNRSVIIVNEISK